MQGKTVQIVSQNNSATSNIYEKLASPKYNLEFIVAILGNGENKNKFIQNQDGRYPNFDKWELKEDTDILEKDILNKSVQLKSFFDKQERLALLKQELSQISLEQKYFLQYINDLKYELDLKNFRKKNSAKKWLKIWQEIQRIFEQGKKIGLFFRVKAFFQLGIWRQNFYRKSNHEIITIFQAMYYDTRRNELQTEIVKLEQEIEGTGSDLLENFTEQSMKLFKNKLAQKYKDKRDKKRNEFYLDDLWKNSKEVINEYPVVLSTTFSARSNLGKDFIFDYLIMDEASQVDITTGALALSSAKNAVIVGDTKQLPNILNRKGEADFIFNMYDINLGYHLKNSFLQSVLDVIPDINQTLLREHYSQRQIDVIKREILPKYITDKNDIGIISPYRNQTNHLKNEIKGIEAETVHKYQGKEKDVIIISTVDDQISDFVDDPYLINVAVSRAKKKLILVLTGNEQNKERNITELLEYIHYNNFEVINSQIYSVFDYLYQQYTRERIKYLEGHKKISEYDSENLMYVLIKNILHEKYIELNVVCHCPLCMLIRNGELLSEREKEYVKNPATHVDFLIYSRISRKPILGIEVNGYQYHKEGTVQSKRDALKKHIFDMYNVRLLSFETNGSGEKEKIEEELNQIMN